MVKFSSQANSLMFVLITIQVTHNEAGSLRTQSALSSNESSSAVPKSLNVNDDKRLTTYQDILRKQVEERSSLPSVNDVKKADARGTYSYFYVGRWAWHIPLWFTLWFTFYIAFNVVRAIYGHSINPDDYARRKREIQSPFPSTEEINRITDFAIKSFEKFKNKNI